MKIEVTEQDHTLEVLLVRLVEATGLNRAELSRVMGIGYQQLNSWLHGARSPSWNTIMPRLLKVGTFEFKPKEEESA